MVIRLDNREAAVFYMKLHRRGFRRNVEGDWWSNMAWGTHNGMPCTMMQNSDDAGSIYLLIGSGNDRIIDDWRGVRQ